MTVDVTLCECGNTPHIVPLAYTNMRYVKCDHCTTTADAASTDSAAILKWNQKKYIWKNNVRIVPWRGYGILEYFPDDLPAG